MTRRTTVNLDAREGLWPVVGVMLLAVAVPTACVLWFMIQAVRNERLAVRQRLSQVYRSQLVSIGQRLDAFWDEKVAALKPTEGATPAATFARLVRDGVADSVVISDSSRTLRYPTGSGPSPQAEGERSAAWQQAEQLEFGKGDFRQAAAAYQAIANDMDDLDRAARALLAQARCLAKAGEKRAALEILTERLTDDSYRHAVDRQGNLIVPGAQLFALELMPEPEAAANREAVQRLGDCLDDYGEPNMRPDQRRFLMQRLQRIVPDPPQFPTLDAEILAATYLESERHAPDAGCLTATGLPDVWQLPSADGTILALFRTDHLRAEVLALIDNEAGLADSRVEVVSPDGELPEPPPLLTLDAGDRMPGWSLALSLAGPDPFASAASRQVTAYVWTGLLAVAAVAAMTGLAARHVARQLRLTRLKNDLLATVSHELKTPLSSIRAMADTLLDGRCPDAGQRREYLELIARENERLSRLIDNFLAFSRMERNGRSFEFAEIRVADVIDTALEAERDKLASPGCRFDTEVAPSLPPVIGDRDALATVLINLLDNAYKYTGDDKRICLAASSATSAGDAVSLEVRDNGIGLSRRAARRVFDRFYQVDQSLSRQSDGCGLGLSIVQFIVQAHGGSVTVESEPGKGTTFRVTVPAATSQSNKPSET